MVFPPPISGATELYNPDEARDDRHVLHAAGIVGDHTAGGRATTGELVKKIALRRHIRLYIAPTGQTFNEVPPSYVELPVPAPVQS